MIKVNNIVKKYKTGKGTYVNALNGLSMEFPNTGLVFLLGKSGSGKSTLLNCIGGLDIFDEGNIEINGRSSKDFGSSDFDSYRNTYIGFIFQEYNILEEFTVEKNVSLALELQGKKADKESVNKILDEVGLNELGKRKPNQLSGGQKQRVAIARALVKDPKIIMADEPTGALDSVTGQQVIETLKELSKSRLVIIVSHDREFAMDYGDRIIELKDGNIISDTTKTTAEGKNLSEGINLVGEELIHIKKGHKLTEKDIKSFQAFLSKKIKTQDAFISVSKTENDSIRKSARITDKNEAIVFKSSKETDVLDYSKNGKQLDLIKSKMRYRDSFKIGASSLKVKPIRLIFTILFSFIAFAMFGVIDVISTYNKADTIYNSINQSNGDFYYIANKPYDALDLISTEQEKQIESAVKESKFPIIYKETRIDIVNAFGTDIDHSGITKYNTNIADLNLEVIKGSAPADNEILISRYIADNIIENTKYYIEKITEDNILGQKIKLGADEYTISGIVSNGVDFDEDAISKLPFDQQQPLMEYYYNHTAVRLMYLSETEFEIKKTEYRKTNINLSLYTESNDNSIWLDFYNVDIDNSLPLDTFVVPQNTWLYSFNNDPSGEVKDFFFLDWKKSIPAGEITFQKGFSLGSNYTMSQDTYDKYTKGIDGYLVEFIDDASKQSIDALIGEDANHLGLDVFINASTIINLFDDLLVTLSEIFLYVGIGFAVFAGLLLMNFISTSIVNKTKEIGVLRAIGASGKNVFAIFFTEALLIAAISIVLAITGTFVTSLLINNVIASDLGYALSIMNFTIRQVGLITLVGSGVAILASLLPIIKISRKTPIDSINKR